jgi:hypothetical protein
MYESPYELPYESPYDLVHIRFHVRYESAPISILNCTRFNFSGNIIFAVQFRESPPNHMGNRTLIHTGFVLGVNALVSYRTEIRIAIRFAANRMGIRSGNRMRVDGP